MDTINVSKTLSYILNFYFQLCNIQATSWGYQSRFFRVEAPFSNNSDCTKSVFVHTKNILISNEKLDKSRFDNFSADIWLDFSFYMNTSTEWNGCFQLRLLLSVFKQEYYLNWQIFWSLFSFANLENEFGTKLSRWVIQGIMRSVIQNRTFMVFSAWQSSTTGFNVTCLQVLVLRSFPRYLSLVIADNLSKPGLFQITLKKRNRRNKSEDHFFSCKEKYGWKWSPYR